MSAAGTMFLVVGASGVGKDALIRAARPRLLKYGFVFPRRWITAAADRGEDHIPVDGTEFDEAIRRGFLDLHWEAHGLRYAIPATVHDDLAAGRHVLANVSRAVVAEARLRFARRRIVHVTASVDTLRSRLSGRARESAAEISERLARAASFERGDDVVVFSNELSLAESAPLFADMILDAR